MMNDIQALVEKAADYAQNLPPAPPPPQMPVGAAIASWIDHTLLKATATAEAIDALCQEAKTYQFAAVCVNPAFVGRVKEQLAGSAVAVCSVISFPLGAHTPEQKAGETQAALRDGATEIDMVMNIGAMKGGDYALVYADIQAVAETCHAQGAHLKVILENAYLTRYEKILASLISQAAGADYVKTSTGFAPTGATPEDVDIMHRTVGSQIGVKAAGGVRTLDAALQMIAAGATRIGASAGVKIVAEAKAKTL